MKMKMPARKWLPLAAAACVCCALNLAAQTPPTITTQPLSQTNLAGTTVAFTVAVSVPLPPRGMVSVGVLSVPL